MGINDIILYIMLGLMALGGIDYFLGKKFGIGIKYEEGFMAMGALTMSMAGAICIAPVLGRVLEPILAPIFQVVGASPAMFATTILANDMGGYPLAMSLAGVDLNNMAAASQAAINAGNFAGLILGSMMGATVVFSIPVGLGIIDIKDRPFLAKGILIGLITIPLGCIAGGAVAGYNFIWMLQNLIPVIVFAIVVALGLVFAQKIMITLFLWFGKFVVAFLTLALVVAGVEGATAGQITLISGMAPIGEAFAIVGGIAVVLAGAFSLVYLLTRYLGGPLEKVGNLLGMNKNAAAGMVATLANNIAMFSIMKDMDDRGKVINVAFAVSAAFVFGDHLGFTAGINKEMISAVIVGKLVGGITAVIIAYFAVAKNDKVA
ncbi:MAG: ethanolamine utilization protein EutH [Elusimicrobiota bacterium]|jgi:ethanolamine transporter|nr:ethanolamine utilization protein EutH [Elusimicrobiota bacterium]